MSERTYNFLSFLSLILLLTIFACSSPQKEKRFSLKTLLGTTSKPEEVIIDQHFNWTTITEYRDEIKIFYQNREFKPVWFNNNSLNPLGEELITELKEAWKEGIPEPAKFLTNIENALIQLSNSSSIDNPKAQIITEADVSLTQLYFDFASKIYSGILDPAELEVIWEILPDEIDLVEHLEVALTKGDISGSFNQLRPKHEQYDLLLEAFSNLMQIKKSGGWLLPGKMPLLKEKETHHKIALVKKHLLATGDHNETDSTWLNSVTFDSKLSEAVNKFQSRHGLEQDGIIGQSTLDQMNVPIDYRIDQIRLNLDRIRWYPDNFGQTHIKINIPAFSFEFFEKGKVQQEMKVVVGQNENYTPVLEDTLYAVVINPTWNVPNSIATNEIFPKMLQDSTYMKRNRYDILRSSYVSTDTIDYITYDWSDTPRDSFPFFIVQHPGPLNSLGRVQFLLQNQYSIYLHDTPANHLFNIEQRDFSHGCVRLERPAELAVTLLKEQLPNDTIIKYLSEDEKKIIRLEEKIPVHLTYQTAWRDKDDLLHFREDIYGFDELSMPVLRNMFSR